MIASTIALMRDIIISSVDILNFSSTKEKYMFISMYIIAIAIKNIGRGHTTIHIPRSTNNPCHIIKLISGDIYADAQVNILFEVLDMCLLAASKLNPCNS